MFELRVLLFLVGFGACVAAVGAMGSQEPRTEAVQFSAEDGVALTGTLTGSGPDFVVLSNQHHATEFLWSTAVDDLSRSGFTVLTYNYRGIGSSSGAEDVPATDRDLRAAYRFAQSRGARRIALMGASLGSIVSLKLTPELKPTAVVLLSVARGFLGQDLPSDPSVGVVSPLIVVTSEYDFVREDTESIAGQLGARATLLVVPTSDHGTALLEGAAGEEVRSRVLSFLKAAFR